MSYRDSFNLETRTEEDFWHGASSADFYEDPGFFRQALLDYADQRLGEHAQEYMTRASLIRGESKIDWAMGGALSYRSMVNTIDANAHAIEQGWAKPQEILELYEPSGFLPISAMLQTPPQRAVALTRLFERAMPGHDTSVLDTPRTSLGGKSLMQYAMLDEDKLRAVEELIVYDEYGF